LFADESDPYAFEPVIMRRHCREDEQASRRVLLFLLHALSFRLSSLSWDVFFRLYLRRASSLLYTSVHQHPLLAFAFLGRLEARSKSRRGGISSTSDILTSIHYIYSSTSDFNPPSPKFPHLPQLPSRSPPSGLPPTPSLALCLPRKASSK